MVPQPTSPTRFLEIRLPYQLKPINPRRGNKSMSQLLANKRLSFQYINMFIMTVAAAEVVVGLAIILTIFRTRHDMDVDHIDVLKG